MKDHCVWNHRRLLSYLEGKISGREKAVFDRHLVNCSSCQNLVERSGAAYLRYINEPKQDVPSDVWPRIQEKLDKKSQRTTPSRILGDRIFPLTAALSIFAAVLFGLELSQMNVKGDPDTPVQSASLSFTRAYMVDFEDIPGGSLADFYLHPGSHQEDIE